MNLLSSMESPMVSSELVFLKSGSDFVFTLRRLSQGSKCVERPLSRINVLLTQTLVGGCSFPRQVFRIITLPSGSFWAYGRPLSPMRWSKTWCASIRSLPIRSSMSASFGVLGLYGQYHGDVGTVWQRVVREFLGCCHIRWVLEEWGGIHNQCFTQHNH